MSMGKMLFVCAAAVLSFSAKVVKATELYQVDRNGNRVPLPAQPDDGQEGGKAEGFKLSLKAEKKEYVLGEQIDLKYVFKNLDRDLPSEKGLVATPALQQSVVFGFAFRLEIRRPDGTLAPVTPRGERLKKVLRRMPSFRTGPSSPGTKEEGSFRAVNLYFDMKQIGEYQLRVSRPVFKRPENMQHENDREATLFSNVVKIRIAAPDEQK